MGKFRDLTGAKFGRLTVVSLHSKPYKDVWGTQHHPEWNCLCDCGGSSVSSSSNLNSGAAKSCGCLQKELASKSNKTHGMRNLPEYKIWQYMKKRVLNTNNKNYNDYGGRGISVYSEWIDDFPAFYEHIGPRPTPKHSIDRIDNNGNYEPGNVRWATVSEQRNNTRSNVMITFNGVTKTLAQWCRELGVSYRLVKDRLRLGWSEDRAFSEHVNGGSST